VTRRTLKESAEFKPLPSPVFPVGQESAPPVYDEISPGHLVLQDD
jgi:peptide/nickel transport system ATP-binding protein/glutathione transport system ATP-binding protein